MADFTNNNIQDTYQRVLQLDSDQIQDGTGSVVLSSTELSSIQAIGTPAIAASEWTQIKNIGSAQISAGEWGYVATMQNVSTTASPTFAKLSLNGSGGTLDPILGYPSSGSKNDPHIGVIRGSSMYFREAEDPNNLEISFVSGLAADIAHIKNTGTLHNALGNAAADTANTASLASNLIGLNTSDILTTNTNQIISGLKTIYASNKLFFRDTDIYLNSNTDGTLQIVSDNNVNIFGNNVKVFAPLTSSALWLSGSLSENVYINNGHITASGDISSSGNIIANNYFMRDHIAIAETTNKIAFGFENYTSIQIGKNNNPITLVGNVTASGNISSSGKIYGRQFEQIETNCAINFNGGHFAYLPLSNQNTNDSELSTNLNINRVAVVPGKPVKSIIRATGNSLGDNTPYTMSYWEAKETEPTTPIFKAAVYADTDSSSNKDAIRFDWSSPNSGSTIDIEEGSRIFMSLSSSNSGNTGYIITHLWEWDYNS